MTIRRDGPTIRLEGDCWLEDAEPLCHLLESHSVAAVDVSGLGRLHSSVLQVLMVFRPEIVGSNGDEFFEAWIRPALTGPIGRR